MMEETNKGLEVAGQTPEKLAIKLKRKERRQIKKQKKRLEKQQEDERKKLELINGPKDSRVKIISREFANKLTEPCNSHTNGSRNMQLTPNEFPSLDEIGNKPGSINFTPGMNCNNFKCERDATEPSVSRVKEESELIEKYISNPSVWNRSRPASTNFTEDINCHNFENENEANKSEKIKVKSEALNITKQNDENKSKKVNFGPVIVNIVDVIKKHKSTKRGTRGGKRKEVRVPGPNGDTVVVVRKKIRQRKKKSEQLDGNLLDSSQPERKKGKQREIPKEKKPSKLKQMIQKDLETMRLEQDNNLPRTDVQTSPVSPSFVGHCHLHYSNNIISDELNNAVTAFLSNIVRFQENMYERNPIKAAAKRRYVVGFREVRKYLLLKKVKVLIVAPNIKADLPNGVLDNTIQDLVSLAALSEIPYVFALSRRVMGKITLKNVPVSVIAVLDYDGTQNEFIKVLERLQIARDEYQKTQPKDPSPQDALTTEIIDNFLNFI